MHLGLFIFEIDSKKMDKSNRKCRYWYLPYRIQFKFPVATQISLKYLLLGEPIQKKTVFCPTYWQKANPVVSNTNYSSFFVTKSFNCTNKKNSLLKSKKLNAKFSFTRNCIKNVSFTKKARKNFQIFFGVILPFFVASKVT